MQGRATTVFDRNTRVAQCIFLKWNRSSQKSSPHRKKFSLQFSMRPSRLNWKKTRFETGGHITRHTGRALWLQIQNGRRTLKVSPKKNTVRKVGSSIQPRSVMIEASLRYSRVVDIFYYTVVGNSDLRLLDMGGNKRIPRFRRCVAFGDT